MKFRAARQGSHKVQNKIKGDDADKRRTESKAEGQAERQAGKTSKIDEGRAAAVGRRQKGGS